MKKLEKMVIVTGLIVGLSAGTPPPAEADSIADKPLPILFSSTRPAKHVYSVTEIVNRGGVTTSFHCTSTEKTGGKDIVWGVEVFTGPVLVNDVTGGEGVLILSPGDTDVISIDFTEALGAEGLLANPTVFSGSARILAESKEIICTAFLVDPDNNPPTFMTTLPLFKKTRQSGQ